MGVGKWRGVGGMGILLPPASCLLADTQAGPSGPLPPPPVEFLQRGPWPSSGQDLEQRRCPKAFID